MISEDGLRVLVQRILKELEEEKPASMQKKIYMLCTSQWDDRFLAYVKSMEQEPGSYVYPVIPHSWKKLGYEEVLLACPACKGILYRSGEKPVDLEQAITVLPVVPRDVVVKTALCLSDTFETRWIASCIQTGSRIAFLNSGLTRFSGKEPEAYIDKILSYYRLILEFGIELCGERSVTYAAPVVDAESPKIFKAERKKRVITSSNITQFASDGILYLHKGDLITDLAKDKAKYLNIAMKE